MLAGIIFMVLSAMLFLFAYLLYFKEAYWLISGINFTPRETVRERYDLTGLTRHLARMCALIGIVLLVSGVGDRIYLINLGSEEENENLRLEILRKMAVGSGPQME